MDRFRYLAFGDKTNPLTPQPTVKIILGMWSGGEDGAPVVSSECMTEGEIDFEVNASVRSLERVRRNAKRALRRRQSK